MSTTIKTALGEFEKEKFEALLDIRHAALEGIRGYFHKDGGIPREVTTSSLVNIAGSCENPHASLKVNYYGREAHLSQSAQLQLEALVLRFQKPFFTVNNSFREEHYDDPEAQGRRLSEFTLVENEFPLYIGASPDDAMNHLIKEERKLVSHVISDVIHEWSDNISRIKLLGGDVKRLGRLTRAGQECFQTITYDSALELLNRQEGSYKFGDDLGIKEERRILKNFDNFPVFITHFPASLKFFNLKRTPDGLRTYSADLLLPPLGETIGGGVREENGEVIKKQFLESKVAAFLLEKGQNPLAPFQEYFSIFEQEEPLIRGGYGIGFERFVGFLLNSNDILDTIAYRTLQPEGGSA